MRRCSVITTGTIETDHIAALEGLARMEAKGSGVSVQACLKDPRWRVAESWWRRWCPLQSNTDTALNQIAELLIQIKRNKTFHD